MRARRLLVLAVAALLLAASCSFPGAKRGPMTVTAIFDDVGDLVVNHAVQVADVRVGSVTKIELTEDFKAKVTMSLQRVDLPPDAVAELRTTSLLGEKFIALRPCVRALDDTATRTVCTGAGGTLPQRAEIPPERAKEAPELEFVAEQAVLLLGGNLAQDLSTLVNEGSLAFGGREGDLRGVIADLATISGTLADQTSQITGIIDGLDKATSTLAASDADLGQLLTNLSQATTVLANNRQRAVDSLAALTRLAQAQNREVFDPYIERVNQQIQQLDRILGEVARGRGEVGNLIDWLQRFAYKIPQGIPGDYAQVYGWFVVCPTDGC